MDDIYSQITPVIIVKNGAPYVKRTLDSLVDFQDVVVYDNGSTDGTQTLASDYPNVRLVQGDFLGFGPTKNKAVSHAKTDWVLSLDIDENVTDKLLQGLKNWQFEQSANVGEILRHNYFCGKHIRTNGWGNDWLCRLYNRQQHRFTDSAVHERLELGEHSKVQRLQGAIEHQATTDVGQMLHKIQQYSELNAQAGRARLYPFPVIVLKSLFGFFRSYILTGGIASGSRGFIIAFGEAVGVFYKYAKVYQRKHY